MPRDVYKTENGDRLSARLDMSYFMGLIKPADMLKFWNKLADFVKDAKPRTTWVNWENGITTRTADCQVAATIYTTQDSFVVRFTVRDTSTLDSTKR